MIVCPNCKEEIDSDSWYCDQCGQHLSFCERCGKVGLGKRCISCGGLMLPADEFYGRGGAQDDAESESSATQLMLFNDSLGIRIAGVNGAIIGRRQGPYAQYFQQNLYVSGVHAQIKFDPTMGWCVADKHSSNGTKVNDRQLMPDVDTPLKNGDILVLANVSLKVSIK